MLEETAIIIHSLNPTFVPSLSEIGGLSCITSILFGSTPAFIMDTLLQEKFTQQSVLFGQRKASTMIQLPNRLVSYFNLSLLGLGLEALLNLKFPLA